jgi:tRNA (mo5U34)-methyltransferase
MNETLKDMNEIRFWHQVPLDDGRVTPGQVPISKLENAYLFSSLDFKGKSVIDIGCWDGYFSFMAEKRGATRVVGFDDPSYRWGEMDGWNFLKDHFNSKAEFVRGTIYDPPREKFDIVLCYGVLYHLNDPLTAAINSFQMAKEVVVFEGLMFDAPDPILYLIEPGALGGDPSNIYLASTGWLKKVAEMNGFELVQHVQQNPQRGTMMFRAVAPKSPGWPAHCYSLPPANLRS